MPFIARWPGKIPAGTVSDQLVSNIDLLTTMAALTEQGLKDDEGPDSYDIMPALTGETDDQIRDHLAIAAFRKSHLSLRDGDWMYIPAQAGGGFSSPKVGTHGFGGHAALHFAGQTNSDMAHGRVKPDAPKAQLYNLKSDPYQAENVIEQNPEIANRLKRRLAAIQAARKTRP